MVTFQARPSKEFREKHLVALHDLVTSVPKPKLRLGMIARQRVAIDDFSKRLFHRIHSGPYITAGKRFGWNGVGIGINRAIVEYCIKRGLRLCILYEPYHDRYYPCKVSSDHLLKFAKQHGSDRIKKFRTKLCVVPFNVKLFPSKKGTKAAETVDQAMKIIMRT